MELTSLKRYKRIFRVKTRPTRTRSENEELYASVVRHFSESDVPVEYETVENFIYNIKSHEQSKSLK